MTAMDCPGETHWEVKMQYHKTIQGEFCDRLNRFIAHVRIDGKEETVHVKNTGRCRELLLPGAPVILQICDNPKRKTKYDLIAVEKPGKGWVNIDSQAPNQVMAEWLEKQDFHCIRREYVYGKSRLDFYMEQDDRKYLMEVKGCTLEIDGVGYFPDAPSERAVKHLRELVDGVQHGFTGILAFVIPMEGVTEVRPNLQTHPAFGEALQDALAAGVKVWYLPCRVTQDSLHIEACVEHIV